MPSQTQHAARAQSNLEEQPEDRATNSAVHKLFRPIKIRGLLLPNRIVVLPMGMYSARDGHFSDFHLMHLGNFAFRGAGLTMVEVSAVLPNGRPSLLDVGIWDDSQIHGMKKVADFVHGMEGERKIGIQLGHAGRKASMTPIYPGQRTKIVGKEEGGWADEVWGASAVPFMQNYVTRKQMTQSDIDIVVQAFVDASGRVTPDAIEIHAAHGYLLSSFLSPCSNSRTDSYGGSFENRIRFLVNVVCAIRARIPQTMPLFVRISATDWMEYNPKTPQWAMQDSINLALTLSDLGVDSIDVSSAANNPAQRVPLDDASYQINLAEQIRKTLKDRGKAFWSPLLERSTTPSWREMCWRARKRTWSLWRNSF